MSVQEFGLVVALLRSTLDDHKLPPKDQASTLASVTHHGISASSLPPRLSVTADPISSVIAMNKESSFFTFRG